MTTNIEHAPKVTHLVFVHAYHNLPGISQGEWVAYYDLVGIDRLRQDLRRYIQSQLDLFSESFDYGEYFSVAEYDGVWDGLAEDDVKVFKLALSPADRNTAFEELHPSDALNGLRAVVLHHIGEGDLDRLRWALSLFDGIIESAVEGVEFSNPRSYIKLQTTEEFAPWFIDRLLESFEYLRQECRSDPYEKFVGETFEPLRPLLEKLRPMIGRDGWPRNDLALGRFLLIVDYFTQVVEEYVHS